MTDIIQANGSNAVPPKTKQHALRWRIIPGTSLAISAWIGAVDMLFALSTYGGSQVDPSDPSLRRTFFTPSIIVICLEIVVAGMSAFAWFYKKWRLAWIGTFICFALMLAPIWLRSV